MDYSRPLLPPTVSRALGWSVVYVLLVAGIFTFPNAPSSGLDPSWRMALGYFYEHGMQFGKDVVFTYGPLGFVMGKTFSGLQFWPLIVGQLILAVISAAVIVWQGWQLAGARRIVFFLFFFLFGMLYEDALHMMVLAILGFALLKIVDQPDRAKVVVIATILAGYSQIKFTDCLLAGFIVAVASVFAAWRRQFAVLGWLLGVFAVVYLGIWVGCGQHLGNLPAYFRGSWEISQGYQWAMGFPAPWAALWKGMVILGVLAIYAVLPLFLHPDKPKAWANSLLLGAYIYLNWKHGFVRADGHMLGFFFCAMLPLIAYPALLGDAPIFRFAHRWVFVLTLGLAVIALEAAFDSTVRLSLSWMQDRIWRNFAQVIDWQGTRQRFREQLAVARATSDLTQTRLAIGNSTVDVLGVEQSVALFNQFNYRPRPVIQSYSTFTPRLAQLNGEFIASDDAPDYFLSRIETIDNRLLTLDDAQVLQLLPYRYEYLFTEKSFLLWKKLPEKFDAAALQPKLIRSTTARVNEPLNVADLQGTPLWARIDVETSFLGKLRAFFYKPPQVFLNVADTGGSGRDFLMPLPQGRNGFILTPLISDTVDYMRYASGEPDRWAGKITVKVAPDEARFFKPEAKVEFSALPPLPKNGNKYFPKDIAKMFSMFKTPPIAYESHTPFSVTAVDGRELAVLHAPSLVTFNLPSGAKRMSGMFGFMVETYTNGAHTNGAQFVVFWSNGSERRDLFSQFLNPLSVKEDRGLHEFDVSLEGLSPGLLFLEIQPGPYNDIGWDWTGWTNVSITR